MVLVIGLAVALVSSSSYTSCSAVASSLWWEKVSCLVSRATANTRSRLAALATHAWWLVGGGEGTLRRLRSDTIRNLQEEEDQGDAPWEWHEVGFGTGQNDASLTFALRPGHGPPLLILHGTALILIGWG